MLHDDPFLAFPDLSEEKLAALPASSKGWGTALRSFGPFKRMALGAGLGAAKSMVSGDEDTAGSAARGAMVGAMIPTGMIGKSMGGKTQRDIAKQTKEIAARKAAKDAVQRPGGPVKPPKSQSVTPGATSGPTSAMTPEERAAKVVGEARGGKMKTPGGPTGRQSTPYSREALFESMRSSGARGNRNKEAALGVLQLDGIWIPG